MARFSHICILLAFIGILLLPQSAQASIRAASCSTASVAGQYTVKMVDCVETSVKMAVSEVMDVLTLYMKPIVAAMFALSLMFFGIRILGGETDILSDAMRFLLRMSLIYYFTLNFSIYSTYIFGVVNQGIVLVTGANFSPWVQMDSFLGKLMGFAPGYTVANGMLGLIGAALFSKTTGVMLFVAGMTALITLLMFVFQIVYIYLMAIIVIGFLIIISPLIIPLAIFDYTERYVTQWLNMMISAMLTPIIMFAVLSVFLGIFDLQIKNIFALLGYNPSAYSSTDSPPPNFTPFWREHQPVMSWMMPTDPNTMKHLADLPAPSDDNNLPKLPPNARLMTPSIQSYINPYVHQSMDMGTMHLPGIDFGKNDNSVKQSLVYAFVELLIFTLLMKGMLARVPEIASSIAGATTGISMESSGIQQKVEGFTQQLTSAASESSQASPRPAPK